MALSLTKTTQSVFEALTHCYNDFKQRQLKGKFIDKMTKSVTLGLGIPGLSNEKVCFSLSCSPYKHQDMLCGQKTFACTLWIPDIIIPFPDSDSFWRPWKTSLLKTLWEEEKLLVTSNFSFSHSVFYPFGQLSAIYVKFETVVCKLFSVWKSLTFVVW